MYRLLSVTQISKLSWFVHHQLLLQCSTAVICISSAALSLFTGTFSMTGRRRYGPSCGESSRRLLRMPSWSLSDDMTKPFLPSKYYHVENLTASNLPEAYYCLGAVGDSCTLIRHHIYSALAQSPYPYTGKTVSFTVWPDWWTSG